MNVLPAGKQAEVASIFSLPASQDSLLPLQHLRKPTRTGTAGSALPVTPRALPGEPEGVRPRLPFS